MKVLALNLPQFHEIPENNEWWGKGFTEWTNVKKAVPLFEGHSQPKKPIDGYYYDLTKKKDINRQAELAKKYGLSGFVYFHYWYEGRKLLEKPCEILLDNKDIDIEYCFCWANHSWTRAWDGKENQVLLEQTYGKEQDWDKHIEYLLKFFADERYIKKDNRPVLVIYNTSVIPNVDKMIEFWNKKLNQKGYGNLYIIEYISTKCPKPGCSFSDAVYEDEPLYTLRFEINVIEIAKRLYAKKTETIDYQDYDRIWNLLLKKNRTYNGRKIVRGCFTDWDNSPRRGKNGSMIVKGASPSKFRVYFNELLNNCDRKDISNDFVIINAWNEWGEGAILEPSVHDGYGYLEAVFEAKEFLENND